MVSTGPVTVFESAGDVCSGNETGVDKSVGRGVLAVDRLRRRAALGLRFKGGSRISDTNDPNASFRTGPASTFARTMGGRLLSSSANRCASTLVAANAQAGCAQKPTVLTRQAVPGGA